MSNQYNLVADQYDLSFQLVPYRLHIEAYSLFEVLGDVTDLKVLELATGTGFYARALRRAGAAQVIGVDIADQMIQIARGAEAAEPLGIKYYVQDVSQLQGDASFDLALAVYLLHYAPTKAALLTMCQAVASHLKPGGRFVTYQLNPKISGEPNFYHDLGLSLSVQPNYIDGEAVPFAVTLGEVTLPEIMAYRWDQATVDQALTTAGFTAIRWIAPKLSPAGIELYGSNGFAQYLSRPHAVLIECSKG